MVQTMKNQLDFSSLLHNAKWKMPTWLFGEKHSCKQEFPMHLTWFSNIKPPPNLHDNNKGEKKNKTFLFLHRPNNIYIVRWYCGILWEKNRLK